MIKIKLFDYATYPSIQQWYEEMSNEGWHIQNIKWNWLHFFKKGEPKETRYLFEPFKMNYFQSTFNPVAYEDFKKMSSKKGYEHIASSRGLELFELIDQEKRKNKGVYDRPADRKEQLQEMSKSDIAGLWGATIMLVFYLALIFDDRFFLNVLFSNFVASLTCIGFILAIALVGRTFYYSSFYLKNYDAWKSDNRELVFKSLSHNRFYSIMLGIVLLLTIATLVLLPGEALKKAEFLYFAVILLIILILAEVLNGKIKNSTRFTAFQKQTLTIGVVVAIVFGINYFREDVLNMVKEKYEVEQQVVYRSEFLIDLPDDRYKETLFEESSFLVPVNSRYECEYNEERNQTLESEEEKDWLRINYYKTVHPKVAKELVKKKIAAQKRWDELVYRAKKSTKDVHESDQEEFKRKLDAISLRIANGYDFETNWDVDAAYRFENPSAVVVLKGDEVWIYSTREIEAVIEKLGQIF